MIPVVISELRGWASNFSRTSISAFAIAMALAGGLSLVQPRACLILLVVMMTWLGWVAGLQRWEILKAWAWIKREALSPAVYTGGKFLAGLLLCLIHLAFVSPVVILMMIVWGLPAGLFFAGAGIGFLSYALALGVGLSVHKDGALLAGLPSGFVVFIWSVLCVGLADLRPFSPFLQMWKLLGEGDFSAVAVTAGSGLANPDPAPANNPNGVPVELALLVNAGIVVALFALATLRQSAWKKG